MRNVSHVVLGLLVAFAMACGGGGDGTGPNGDGNGNGDDDGDDTAGSVAAEITMDQTAFIDPDGRRNESASVTIQVGETVRWTNNDAVVHTVDSGEGEAGNDGAGVPAGATAVLNSGNLDPGETYRFTFETAGTWTYYCRFHDGTMINATVVVEE